VPFSSATSPAVTSTTMETPAEACSAARGESARVAAVIEAAERAGMHAVKRAAMKGAATAGVMI